jgi:hypothetical protein
MIFETVHKPYLGTIPKYVLDHKSVLLILLCRGTKEILWDETSRSPAASKSLPRHSSTHLSW